MDFGSCHKSGIYSRVNVKDDFLTGKAGCIVYLSDSVSDETVNVLCESFTLTESNSLTCAVCLCSDGREGISIYFGSYLCANELAHYASCKISNTCFIHILTVNRERTCSVLFKREYLLCYGNSTLCESCVLVIVAETGKSNNRELNLMSSNEFSGHTLVFKDGCLRFLNEKLIKFSCEFSCKSNIVD